MYVKINWDVVVDKGLWKIWIDIIAWDHEGIVMAAQSLTNKFLVEPNVA